MPSRAHGPRRRGYRAGCDGPNAAPGTRLEIYGTAGRLTLTCGGINVGPNDLHGAKGKDEPRPLPIPARLQLVADTIPGAPISVNVALNYERFAEAFTAGTAVEPNFATALGMHRLIDTIERASAAG